MTDTVERLPVLHVTEAGVSEAEAMVTKEFSLTIILNNQELLSRLCTPANLEYLAVGFLFSEGLLKSKDERLHKQMEGSYIEAPSRRGDTLR